MPRARVEPEGLPAGTLTFRVGDKHKAILDQMVAEDPRANAWSDCSCSS
jgi:hypothetical protein